MLDALRVRRDFVAAHPERVAHLPAARLAELTDGYLLREAYRAYWRRDLDDAQVLLRAALREGAWQLRDLKYILPALLPAPLFRRLVGLAGGRASSPLSKSSEERTLAPEHTAAQSGEAGAALATPTLYLIFSHDRQRQLARLVKAIRWLSPTARIAVAS